MSRIRSIKPEFWSSAQVMECSPMARLFFIGLWNFCDDDGRHPVSARTLKALIFPGDDIAAAATLGFVAELERNGLVETYEVDGKPYLQVTGWRHQKIDKPQPSKYPPPPEAGAKRPFDDHSSNDRRMVDDHSRRKGEEGKGKDLSSSFSAGAGEREVLDAEPAEPAEPGPGPAAKRPEIDLGNVVPLGRDAFQAECRALMAGCPVEIAQDFELLRAVLDEGVTKPDVFAGLSAARDKPGTRWVAWAQLAGWARKAAKNRIGAEQQARAGPERPEQFGNKRRENRGKTGQAALMERLNGNRRDGECEPAEAFAGLTIDGRAVAVS